MSRPHPTVLIEQQEGERVEQIIVSTGIYSVYYQNKPINYKSVPIEAFVQIKYKPVSFSSRGPAINLAKKLNKKFKTKDFTVVKFTDEETIYSE